MSRERRVLAALIGLYASVAASPAHGLEVEKHDPRRFVLEAGLAYAGTQMANEGILPRAAHAGPSGGGPFVAAGLVLGNFILGPRFAWELHVQGSQAQILLGEMQYRFPRFGGDQLRLVFRLGFGYAWFEDLDLRKLGLGTYDSGGFAMGFGPRIIWELMPDTMLVFGFRLHFLGATRPVLGPCDDEHGCNGVFYPDEKKTAGLGTIGIEVAISRDLF